MPSLVLHTNRIAWHCRRWGSGERLLIAFHGYGNDASLFGSFAEYVEELFTVIAVDLPYHGTTHTPTNETVSKQDISLLIKQLMSRVGVARFSLMSFSMGGRLAMIALEMLASCVDKVLLIASDGLDNNGTYHFATRNILGKRIFHFITGKQNSLPKLLKLMNQVKLIGNNRTKFLLYYVGDAAKRKELRLRWLALQHMVPNFALLTYTINKYAVPVHLVFGKYDKIIPPTNGRKLKNACTTVSCTVAEAGHQLIVPQYFELYRHLLIA